MRSLFTLLLTFAPLAVGGEGGIDVGEEFPLLADGPGRGIQATPDVAFGGGAYLAVWREGWHGKGGSARIYAARVSADGKVLDPKGIEVSPCKNGVQEQPRVAFGGGAFLVVWQDLRNGKDYDVLAARVSPEGKVLDAEPIAVAAGPRTQALPAVASDGQGFLVVWQGLAGAEAAYRGFAAQVSADGKVGAAVETGATPQPKVAWNGKCYLAACGGAGFWAGEVRSILLGADGKPASKPAPALGGTKAAIFSLSAVPDRGWLVISHRSPPDPWGWGGPGAMRAAFIGPNGTPASPVKEEHPQARLPHWLDFGREKGRGATWPWGHSASAWAGKHSLVVWQRYHLGGEKWTNFENCDLVAARVDGVTSLDPAGVPVAASDADERRPALAADGMGGLLCVYERGSGEGMSHVAARRIGVR
ncbi:MAG TPA: hypothetical protein PLE19_13100 [Planctomycetota bacterium]|nr:hypothetical protein [Planctomycetota bacterium]HRR81115.1 hypothetical protein [Planctomycetota bacterium]HRT96548.1 hypothetical protein [Planctomycetota bacterium]